MTQQQPVESSEQEGPGRPESGNDPKPARSQPRPSTTWAHNGPSFSATIDGRDYRVTKYPADSPLAAPYGAYAEGRFIGSGSTLDAVKARCNAHAGRLRHR